MITILVGMLEWAFNVTQDFYFWWPFVEILCEILFIFDVVIVQFRAAYHDEFFEVIASKTRIFAHYCKTYLIFDLLDQCR